jgi:AcrR family transcriptional regulator
VADSSASEFAASATDRAVERAVISAWQRARAEIGSILDAAWSVFARTGWEDLKIGMVLEQAQVSTRNFYRNFCGKSQLLIALFEEEVNRFAGQLTAAMTKSDGSGRTVDHLDSPEPQACLQPAQPGPHPALRSRGAGACPGVPGRRSPDPPPAARSTGRHSL